MCAYADIESYQRCQICHFLIFFVADIIPPDAFLTLMSVNKVAADRGIKFALKI